MRFYDNNFRRHNQTVNSKKDFNDLKRNASFVHNIPHPFAISVLFPTLIILLGAIIWETDKGMNTNAGISLLFLYSQLLMFSVGGYWLDSRYWDMIIGTAEAFDPPHDRYYKELGDVSRKIFDGFHFVGNDTDRDLHYPTIFLSISIMSGIVIFDLVFLITGVAAVTLTSLYFHFVALLLVFFVVQAIWTLVIAFYFLDIRMPFILKEDDDFNIRIDVLKYRDRMGLGPFFQFLTTGVAISTINLIVIVFALVFVGIPFHISMPLISAQAAVSTIPFFLFQYGFHVHICSRKSDIINHLNRTSELDLNTWFNDSSPNNNEQWTDIYMLIEFKREVERAPEWPSDIILVSQIIFYALLPPILNLILNVI